MKIFVDSDVVISSLISSKGAAFFLLHQTGLDFYISNISLSELEIVVERLKLNRRKLHVLVKDKLYLLKLQASVGELREKYNEYVSDPHDAHIISGARSGKVKFLITYNIKHFRIDKIKRDFNIIVTTPGNFLQYLRSLS